MKATNSFSRKSHVIYFRGRQLQNIETIWLLLEIYFSETTCPISTNMKHSKIIRNGILYKYWLHERIVWKIVTPRKPMSTEAKPRWTLVSKGDDFPYYPWWCNHHPGWFSGWYWFLSNVFQPIRMIYFS